MPNQRITGKNLYVEFIVNGGATYNLSGHQRALNVTFDTDEVDLSAGSDQYAFMKPTVKRNSATLSTHVRGTLDQATWGNLPVDTEGKLLFYPKGKTTGLPKGGFPAYLKSKSIPYTFNGEVMRDAAFSPQGGTYGTDVFDPDVHTYTP